jgi:hypothetical protein
MSDEFDFGNLPEPPPEAYDAVRGRVLASIRRQRRMRLAFRSVLAAAACVVLVWAATLLLRRPPASAPPAPKLAWKPELPPAPVIAQSPSPRARPVRRRTPPRPLVARVERRPPLLIRMQTEDPGVVILWMVD